jgi:hypothetical protein
MPSSSSFPDLLSMQSWPFITVEVDHRPAVSHTSFLRLKICCCDFKHHFFFVRSMLCPSYWVLCSSNGCFCTENCAFSQVYLPAGVGSGWYTPIVWFSQHEGRHLGLGMPQCRKMIQRISGLIQVLIIVYIPGKPTEQATYNRKKQHIKPSFSRKATQTCSITYLLLVLLPKLGIVGPDCSQRSRASSSPHATETQNMINCMQVRNVEDNLDRSLVDANGNPLPPCIVMERGESLDLWVGRARPDSTQALAVRCPSCTTSMF